MGVCLPPLAKRTKLEVGVVWGAGTGALDSVGLSHPPPLPHCAGMLGRYQFLCWVEKGKSIWSSQQAAGRVYIIIHAILLIGCHPVFIGADRNAIEPS